MRESRELSCADMAERLVALYEQPFGSKRRGRYRISMKLVRSLIGRRRIWPEQIEALRRELYELGYLLLDLETYFVVVSQQTFVSYRRVNEAGLNAILDAPDVEAQAGAVPEGASDMTETAG